MIRFQRPPHPLDTRAAHRAQKELTRRATAALKAEIEARKLPPAPQIDPDEIPF